MSVRIPQCPTAPKLLPCLGSRQKPEPETPWSRSASTRHPACSTNGRQGRPVQARELAGVVVSACRLAWGMHKGFGGGGVGCFLACRMAGYGSPDGEPARIDNRQCISAHSVGIAPRPAAGRGRRPSRCPALSQSSQGVGSAASVPAAAGRCQVHTPVGRALVLALPRGALCSPLPPSGYSATCDGGG